MNMRKEAVDRIIRVHIAARLLRCSGRTIRRRIQNQEIPASRIGRRAWGVRVSDLSPSLGNNGGGYVGN
jgi:excisionase family DNA binding protein